MVLSAPRSALGHGDKHLFHHALVQVLFALKVIVKERFIDPGGPGDLIDPRSGQADPGKLLQCRGDNRCFGRDRVSFAFARSAEPEQSSS